MASDLARSTFFSSMTLLLGVAFDTFTLLLSVVSQVFTLREGPGFFGL